MYKADYQLFMIRLAFSFQLMYAGCLHTFIGWENHGFLNKFSTLQLF